MKNIAMLGLVGLLGLSSCTTIQKGKVAQQNQAEYLKLKGQWQLASINYDKSYKIKPFDEGVDAECFVGSMWTLIPNNYSGSYMLAGGQGCPTITQPIKFEVKDGSTFLFKKIAAGTKAKQNDTGYSLTLVNQTDNTFTLQQSVPFQGSFVNVQYNFIKTVK